MLGLMDFIAVEAEAGDFQLHPSQCTGWSMDCSRLLARHKNAFRACRGAQHYENSNHHPLVCCSPQIRFLPSVEFFQTDFVPRHRSQGGDRVIHGKAGAQMRALRLGISGMDARSWPVCGDGPGIAARMIAARTCAPEDSLLGRSSSAAIYFRCDSTNPVSVPDSVAGRPESCASIRRGSGHES
jgi:hypothetical protein